MLSFLKPTRSTFAILIILLIARYLSAFVYYGDSNVLNTIQDVIFGILLLPVWLFALFIGLFDYPNGWIDDGKIIALVVLGLLNIFLYYVYAICIAKIIDRIKLKYKQVKAK